MPEPLLTVTMLDAYYGDFQALFDVSIDIAAGEIVIRQRAGDPRAPVGERGDRP